MIWSTGFNRDHRWIQVPVFDGRGYPMHRRGATACPGLYVLGLPWQHSWGSGRFEAVGGDARFLADALDRLPGADEGDAPATLDLNGRVAVRARGESGPATELVLARSSYTGPPARAAMNRSYLARAARLGFVEVAHIREVGYKFGRWLDLKLLQIVLDGPRQPTDS